MSVWREVQKALYARFVERWQDGGQPVTPFVLENEPEDFAEGPWARLSVKRRSGGPGTIGRPGNRKMDRVGVVFVQLFEPPGKGVGNLSDLGERAAQIFENCRMEPHDIRFAQVEPGNEGLVDDGRWWGVTVEGRFDYEDIR